MRFALKKQQGTKHFLNWALSNLLIWRRGRADSYRVLKRPPIRDLRKSAESTSTSRESSATVTFDQWP
jgi:hypothetical protein